MLNSTMHSRVLTLTAVAVSTLALAPRAEAMVNGSLTVNGAKYKLSNAYAYKESAKPDSDIILVVTDAPVAAGVLRDTFGFIHLVEDGKVHGIKLTLKDKQCISGTVLDKATINASGVWGRDMVAVDSLDNGTLIAHAIQGPETMFKNKFEYTFQVVIPIETPKAEAAATGLLDRSERVLVVYDEGGATLYYESDDAEDGIGRHKLPRAS